MFVKFEVVQALELPNFDLEAPYHAWRSPSGDIWANFYRAGSAYVLNFPYLSDFLVNAGGINVLARPAPGVPLVRLSIFT